MEDRKVISGDTEEEIWRTVNADLADEVYNYEVLIREKNKETELLVDIDLGGGFEGGWEVTTLRAPLSVDNDFRFAIHDKTFIDSIGKFIGLQDVEIGYPAFDDHLIIKTNEENKVPVIFADNDVRKVFTSLDNFDCGIHHHTDDGVEHSFLELNINEGINEPEPLRKIYHAFHTLAARIEDTVG